MKRFLATLTLTCVLSVSALAGTIDTCGLTSERPTSPGDVPSTDVTSPAGLPTCGLSVLLAAFDLAL
jgi:hypothetical protein